MHIFIYLYLYLHLYLYIYLFFYHLYLCTYIMYLITMAPQRIRSYILRASVMRVGGCGEREHAGGPLVEQQRACRVHYISTVSERECHAYIYTHTHTHTHTHYIQPHTQPPIRRTANKSPYPKKDVEFLVKAVATRLEARPFCGWALWVGVINPS